MSLHEALAAAQAQLDDWSARRERPRVLDAGCGRQMYLRVAADAYVVGVDIDSDQLERNPRLHEAIVGDLQTCELPSEDFDLIVCWDVLEHMRRPRQALENLEQALRPGGLLIVGSPNILSLKGLVTKVTPFWLHRLAYRDASSVHPFRTYLRFSMAPARLRAWAERESLATMCYAVYESPMQIRLRHRVRLTGRRWSGLNAAARALSRGAVDLEGTDFVLVLNRPGGTPPEPSNSRDLRAEAGGVAPASSSGAPFVSAVRGYKAVGWKSSTNSRCQSSSTSSAQMRGEASSTPETWRSNIRRT